MKTILSAKHTQQLGFAPYRNRVRITNENQEEILSWNRHYFKANDLKLLSETTHHMGAIAPMRDWLEASSRGRWAYFRQTFFIEDPADMTFFRLRWSA